MKEKGLLTIVFFCLAIAFLIVAVESEGGSTQLTCGNEHIQIGSSLMDVMGNCEVTVQPFPVGSVWWGSETDGKICQQQMMGIDETGFYSAVTPYHITITCGVVSAIVRAD